MNVVIDTHAHMIVPEITRETAPGEIWRPRVYMDGNQQVVEFAGKQIRSTVSDFVHIDKILAAMESAGVDRVVLCPWVNLLLYEKEPDEGLEYSRIQNESLARIAQAHSERVYTLGTVPLQDPELASRELQALMKVPGIHGVELAASVNGVYLGDDRFEPLWSTAEETGALVFIHPTTRGFDFPVFNQYYLWNSVGNPLETTISAAHMIMAGVMERHPKLKVLLAHGGGTILNLRGRLAHAHSFQPQARSRLKESPLQSLRRFYFDTLTHDLELLRALVEFAGPDRVLVGSDYPFDMGASRPAEIVRRLELRQEDEAKILGENAIRLLEKPWQD